MKNTLILLAFLLASTGTVFAKGTPPEAVVKAFQQKFPTASGVEWDKESKTEWEAEFKLNGKSMSANFDLTGNWLETETDVALRDLPAPVQAALKGKKVKETARIERPGGAILYEAEVRHKDLLYDAAGKLVSSGKD